MRTGIARAAVETAARRSLQHRREMAHAASVAEPLAARFQFVTRFKTAARRSHSGTHPGV